MAGEDDETRLARRDRFRVDEGARIVGGEGVFPDKERGRRELDRGLIAVPDVGRDRDLLEGSEADHTGLEPNARSATERVE